MCRSVSALVGVMGIRGQLSLLIAGIVGIGLSVGSYLEVRHERREAMADLREQNEAVLQAMVVTLASHIAEGDLSRVSEEVKGLAASLKQHDLVALLVLDLQGNSLGASSTQQDSLESDAPLRRSAMESEKSIFAIDGDSVVQSAPMGQGTRIGTVIARYSLSRIHSQLARATWRLALTSLAVFFAVLALLFMGLDRLVVRPVLALQHSVRRMGEGHLSTRVPPLRGAELGELTNVINTMASALQHERDNLERSVAERTAELQEANARLERLAVTDGLTGVFNHRRFQEQLQTELLRSERHKRPMGVLMVDVDFFKKVNDALGHPTGDALLRKLAQVLGGELRQTDLIARYGGEEFAVLLPETTKTEAMQVAERMRLAVELRVNADGAWPQPVTVSIGAATFPEDGSTAEQVLTAADQSMYVAKRQGRNRVIGARGVVS